MAPGLDLSHLAGEIGVPSTPPLPKGLTKIGIPSHSSGIMILDPSLITTEFDLLRFEAAAHGQLDTRSNDDNGASTSDETSSLLISSPYNSPGHYLDLSKLDTSNQVFAQALTALKPVRQDYATARYTDALNFSSVLELVKQLSVAGRFQWKEKTFYVVVFRSKLKESIDNDLLYKLDYESHREACESGGLLKYWFGRANSERRNLATCFWSSREDARRGGTGPWHAKARAAGRELYEQIIFSTHRFTILDDATDFKFEDW